MSIDDLSQAIDVLVQAAAKTRTDYGWAAPIVVNRAEAEALMALFGSGGDGMNAYPLLAATIEGSIGRPARTLRLNGEPVCYTAVRDVACDSSGLAAVADVSLDLVPARLMVSLAARRNGQVVGLEHYVGARESSVSLTLYAKGPFADDDTLDVVVVSAWDTDTGQLSTCIDRATAPAANSDPVASLRMAHPVLNYPNPTPDEIEEGQPSFDLAWPQQAPYPHDSTNVCFLRFPEGEVMDYVYREQRDDQGLELMSLDIRGEAELDPRREFKGFESATIGLMLPTTHPNMAAGGVPYSTQLSGEYFRKTDEGFSFGLPTSWSSPIKDSVKAGLRAYDIDITITFSTDQGEGIISASSREGASLPGKKSNAHFASIPSVRLFWGCLEASTLVTMADGSEKPIRDVTVGDQVETMDGAATVTDVVRGSEKELIHFETDDGTHLDVTEHHPLLTAQGVKRADAVVVGEELCGVQNRKTVRFRYPKMDDFEVYNLILDGSSMFVANGLLVGDNNEQGRLMRMPDKAPDPESVSPELLAEVERMRRALM